MTHTKESPARRLDASMRTVRTMLMQVDLTGSFSAGMKPTDLERLGQDVESSVLNRVVRWYAKRRVFENAIRFHCVLFTVIIVAINTI